MTMGIGMLDRLKSNLEILKTLEEYFRENPDQRFNQGLINVGAVLDGHDDYNSEPKVVLDRIHRTLTDLGLERK